MEQEEEEYWEPEEQIFLDDPRAVYQGRFERDEGKRIMSKIRAKGRKDELLKNPLYRFYIYVDAIGRRYIDEGAVSFDLDKLESALRLIEEFENVQYKNPTAYVLAFDVTYASNFTEIDREALRGHVEALRESDSVREVDLLRYAFTWMDAQRGRKV